MDASNVFAVILVLWVMGVGLKRIAGGLLRADSDGVVKKAAKDGAIRVISRILK
jgi:hypothetical protein